MKQKIILLSFSAFLLSSCSSTGEGMSPTTAVIIFIVLIVSLVSLLVWIMRKKRNVKMASESVNVFNQKIRNILAKLNTPQEKIKALEYTLNQLESHEEYNKNHVWKNSLLVTVYVHMATVYHSMGDDQHLLEVCDRILECDPNHAVTYYNRGTLLNNKGEYEKALQDFNTSIELNASFANAYNNRGLVFYNLKQYQSAVNDYNEALKLEESPVTFYNRANAYSALGDKVNATVDYNSYLELDPNNKAGLRNKVAELLKSI